MLVKSIYTGKMPGRLLTIAIGAMLLLGFGFSIKWFFGNSISSQAQRLDVAQYGESLAPHDPQSHYILGLIYEKSFLPEDQPKSLEEFELAIAESPFDFRLWLSLGRARERNGDVDGAFVALNRARQLAPGNAQVLWAYGNVLLRQGKRQEAFVQMRLAVAADPKYASAAANTAWQIFGGDLSLVRKTIGNSPSVNAALAVFLAGNKQYDEAFAIWKTLPDDQVRGDLRENSESLQNSLMKANLFVAALTIQSKLENPDEQVFKVGEVANGGFEESVKTDGAAIFEWQIAQGSQPRISVDNSVKHSGAHSLVFSFSSTKQDEFRSVKQTVALQGGSSHSLDFFYKSELSSDSTLKIEVVDATGASGVLGSSPRLDKQTDWQKVSINFELPTNSQGVEIRFIRDGCTSAVCPLKGKIWFDDFKMN